MRVSTKNKIIEVLRIKYLCTSAYSPLLIKYRSSSLKSWCYSITGWRMMGLVLLTLSKRDNSFCTIYEPNCARFLRPQAFVLSEWPVSTTFLLHEISDAKLYTAHCFVLETCFRNLKTMLYGVSDPAPVSAKRMPKTRNSACCLVWKSHKRTLPGLLNKAYFWLQFIYKALV